MGTQFSRGRVRHNPGGDPDHVPVDPLPTQSTGTHFGARCHRGGFHARGYSDSNRSELVRDGLSVCADRIVTDSLGSARMVVASTIPSCGPGEKRHSGLVYSQVFVVYSTGPTIKHPKPRGSSPPAIDHPSHSPKAGCDDRDTNHHIAARPAIKVSRSTRTKCDEHVVPTCTTYGITTCSCPPRCYTPCP